MDDNAAKVKFNGRTLLNGDVDSTKGVVSGATVAESTAKTVSSKVATMDSSAPEYTSAVYEAPSATSQTAAFKVISSGKAVALTANTFSTSKLVDLVKASVAANTTTANLSDSDYIFKEGDTITLSFTAADGATKSNTVTVDSSTTLGDLFKTDNTSKLTGNGVKVMWGAAMAITDSSGNQVSLATDGVADTTTTNRYYAGGGASAVASANSKTTPNVFTIIGDKGVAIDNVSLSVTSQDGTTSSSEFLSAIGLSSTAGFASKAKVYVDPDAQQTSSASTDLTFYIGGEANFGMDISINKMTTETLLGVDAATFAGYFTSKETLTSNNVIDKIDTALATAMTEQTKLGAYESRLGYASDNLTTMNENLEAADSAMRDSDIAKEMTTYMKYAVLSQASQYMLAQAGQNAFQVLNLLQQ
ncbi:MAG: hypothetical protein IJG33_16690 [Selenomonadaceae bacterium]|nr:hypothetical protein [Selenomonadaceae bacterium]